MSKTTTQTLEDFIKKYTSSGAKNYSDWLKGEDDGEDAYSKAVTEANKQYERSLSGYGRQGEALSRSRLYDSGYSAYLDANAYSEMQRARGDALEKKNTTDAKNKQKYSEYLKSVESERQKLLNSTLKGIDNYHLTDEDSAYDYAVYSGLDEDTAKIAARLGVSVASSMTQKEKISLLGTMRSMGLSRGSMYYYLTALGLPQKEANELADLAEKLPKKYTLKDYINDSQ